MDGFRLFNFSVLGPLRRFCTERRRDALTLLYIEYAVAAQKRDSCKSIFCLTVFSIVQSPEDNESRLLPGRMLPPFFMACLRVNQYGDPYGALANKKTLMPR
jgi:hypothetical protein